MLKPHQLAIFEFVKANPMSSVNQICDGTGISRLAIWRFLTDYDLKNPRRIFRHKKIATKNIGKDGKVNGGHYDVFSVRQGFELSQLVKKSRVNLLQGDIKRNVTSPAIPQRDELTNALFGASR